MAFRAAPPLLLGFLVLLWVPALAVADPQAEVEMGEPGVDDAEMDDGGYCALVDPNATPPVYVDPSRCGP